MISLNIPDIDAQTDEEKLDLEERRERIVDAVHEFADFCQSLGLGSQKNIDGLFDGLQYLTNEKEIESWEDYIAHGMQEQKDSAMELDSTFTSLIDDIEQFKPKAISKASIEEWKARFHDNSIDFVIVEKFVRTELPGYFKRAKEVAKKRKSMVEHPQYFNLTKDEVKDLDKFIDEDKFLALHYAERVSLTATVNAALLALEKNEKARFQSAKAKLTKAASDGYMSSQKVGVWLERIFKSDATPAEIDAFLNGDDATSLSTLIDHWADVREEYDDIETEKKDRGPGGIPRGFRFVNESTFLSWHYTKRLAYVEEAQNRFEEVQKVHPLLLAVRHELDSEDWESARYLISRIEAAELNPDDQKRIESMKRYLKENQSQEPESEVDEMPSDPEAIRKELDKLISYLPKGLQQLYRRAIAIGKIDCLTALMYNRVWCYENNCLDGQREIELQESAADDTREFVEHGAGDTDLLNGDVNTFKGSAVASYSGTGRNGPQLLHVSSASAETLLAEMSAKDSPLFRYWTTLIPKGVDYAVHAFVVKHLNHQIKSKVRELEQTKATVTPVQKETQKKARAAVPDFALPSLA